MRLRGVIVAVSVVGMVLAACGDDDVSRADPDGTTTTTTAGTDASPEPDLGTADDDDDTIVVDGEDDGQRPPEVRMTVDVPADLADELAAVSASARAWVIDLFGMESGSAFAYLGAGVSPEPADVVDPDTPPLGNQALAAAHGVADDLLDGIRQPEVVANEGAALATGRPAWHVSLRFTTSDGPVDVDLVGIDDAGGFHYAFAVTHDLPEQMVQQLRDAVAAAAFD